MSHKASSLSTLVIPLRSKSRCHARSNAGLVLVALARNLDGSGAEHASAPAFLDECDSAQIVNIPRWF